MIGFSSLEWAHVFIFKDISSSPISIFFRMWIWLVGFLYKTQRLPSLLSPIAQYLCDIAFGDAVGYFCGKSGLSRSCNYTVLVWDGRCCSEFSDFPSVCTLSCILDARKYTSQLAWRDKEDVSSKDASWRMSDHIGWSGIDTYVHPELSLSLWIFFFSSVYTLCCSILEYLDSSQVRSWELDDLN